LLNAYVPKNLILSFDKKSKIEDITKIVLQKLYEGDSRYPNDKLLLNANMAREYVNDNCKIERYRNGGTIKTGYVGELLSEADGDIGIFLCEEVPDNEIYYLPESEEVGFLPIRAEVQFLDKLGYFYQTIGMSLHAGGAIVKVILT